MSRDARWDVIVNGTRQQARMTFHEAVRRAAYAHLRGDRWDVRVDNRLLTSAESRQFVATVKEEVLR